MRRWEQLKPAFLRRLARSHLAFGLAERALALKHLPKEQDQVLLRFALDLGEKLFAKDARGVGANIFFPAELLYGLDIPPFYPEVASGLGASLGMAEEGLAKAEAAGYPGDLCTFHRNAVGMKLRGLFPPLRAYVATSHICDVAPQIMANFAYEDEVPFILVDVPPERDEESVDYVERQLEAAVEELCVVTGASFDIDRLREAIRLSNQARRYAIEVMELRRASPSPLRGSGMFGQLALIAFLFGSPHGVEYYRALRDYTHELVERGASEQANQRYRLLWLHLKPYYPNQLLAHLEDELGAAIVFEEMSLVWWDELDERRPLRALAEKILSHPSLGPAKHRAEVVLKLAREFVVDGVVHFNHWGCHQSTGALRIVRDRLRREGIPFLEIDGDCVDGRNLQWGPLLTRIEGFIEMLEG